jgi:hypothetical protein
MKKIAGVILLVLTLSATAFSADFLTSARGGGMGLSYFVLADDPSGALYNPSALGFIKGWQAQFMYNRMANYGYAIKTEEPYDGSFGLVYYKPDAGTFALNSIQSGSFAKLTTIPTQNHAVLSYGRELAVGWSGGVSAKYLMENGFGKRSAYDLDLGISYRSPVGIAAAVAVENALRSKLSPDYLLMEEYLPRRSRLGAGYFFTAHNFQGGVIAAGQIEESGVSQKYATSLLNMGTEWWFLPLSQFSFALRGGYTFGKGVLDDLKSDYSGPTVGLSLNHRIGANDLRLDYAWQAYPFTTADGSKPSSHYVAVTFGWGGVPSYPERKAQEYVQKPRPIKTQPPPETPKVFQPTPKPDMESPLVDKDTDFKNASYLQFEVEMEVSDISSLDLQRIVFYVRPQQVMKSTSWKLYIFKAKVKSWTNEEANKWALQIIEGKGVPPINIIWDGMTRSNELVPKGKYYYLLTAVDDKGKNYSTVWHSFKLN